MSEKLGFTFYVKDWWTSDTYFDLTPIQRYVYLECLFVMYMNDGYMKTQKTQFENRIRCNISDEDWEIVTSKFEKEDDSFTHSSVNKRLKRAVANRENGKKGGRPPTKQKPTKPNSETQNNPPLEREREREIESEYKREIESECEVTIPTQNFPSSFGKQPIETLKKNCANYSEWLTVIAKKNSLTMIGVLEWLDAFELNLLGQGKTEEYESEFKSYFNSWVTSEIRKGRPPTVKNESKDAPKKTAEQIAQEVIIKKYGNRAYEG